MCPTGPGARASPASRSRRSSSGRRSSSSAIRSRPTGLLEEIEGAVAGLDEIGDDRALAVAWTLIGLRFGLWKGRVARGEEALQRALVHARRAGDRRQEATILGQLCFAAWAGPTPVPEAIELCESILAASGGDPLIGASVARYLAPLEARRGRFDEARELANRARAMYEEFGLTLLGQAATALAHRRPRDPRRRLRGRRA